MPAPNRPVHVLGASHRRPFMSPSSAALVVCPMTRRSRPLTDCAACPLCQGMLVGPDPYVLCAAPARGAGRPHSAHRSLVFEEDWPDELG